MANFKLSADNDIIIGRGASRITGPEYTVQLIQCRLSTILGEWELDRGVGVPWADSILVRGVDISSIEGIIHKTIIETPGVASIQSLIAKAGEDRKLVIDVVGKLTGGTSLSIQGFTYGRR